jgi:hypothetical protein
VTIALPIELPQEESSADRAPDNLRLPEAEGTDGRMEGVAEVGSAEVLRAQLGRGAASCV